ncbi:Protein of unknown function (DUF3089) [Novosphingobium kunmingense]|uniref:DUF3089 family protein n=1 Tax=Novosphingobium kunmingense TaxID=1211806 RepID=A0A2N0I475_9SPHN|nr:DUF3089 domain-containing protein [Novosphingobium kunmingense]PKB25989.1 Protein of unknown function (DUF3089) [Novosphingobium kunmingense]
MARKFLFFIAFCIVVYVAGRAALQFYPGALTQAAFTPSVAFKPQPALAKNAYDDPGLWIARPGMGGSNPALWAPAGPVEDAPALSVPVFFVHPTSYVSKKHWNAPLDDAQSRRVAETMVRGEASVFNGSASIWAPRYRQATAGAFVTNKPEARQAVDLAYRDVAEAFDSFAAQLKPGEPFVLAGHSQGSYHVKRLMAEKVRGTPLAARVLAVYAVGWIIDRQHDLAAMGLPACERAGQTGCVVSYLSFTRDADTAMMRAAYATIEGVAAPAGSAPDILCVNPLTGALGGTATKEANTGGLVPDAQLSNAKLIPQLAGASCAPDGTLRIGDGPDLGPYVLPGGNYHVYDYLLFWSNLRTDFLGRVRAWKP